jgi:signal transduction histidine kinase
MNNRHSTDHFTNHTHWLVFIISLLLIVIVALRRRYDLEGGFTIEIMSILLGIFLILYVSEALFSRRIKSYHVIYFSLQFILAQYLGLFRDYQDTWALLYIVLGFQVAVRCSRKEALAWFSLFTASLMITLSFEFGLISGPGRALAYIVMGILFISYDIQYAQHEDALAESQMLIEELQEAHDKLIEYASQSEKLAALQQRNQMLKELYDSVGQKIFAIQLAAETTRLMLEKNPKQATIQIDDLQAQTQTALSQMRQLIEQWRLI